MVRVTADLEGKGKRKIATPEAHVSPCKSLRRSNAFLEERHVSQDPASEAVETETNIPICVMVSG